MPEKWLDNIHNQCDILREDAYFLKNKAESFRNTCNPGIAVILDGIADNMMVAQSEICGNIGLMLSDKIKAGDAQIAKVLKACIAYP